MSTKWNFEFRPLYRAGSPQLSPIGGDDSPKRGAYIIAVVVYATLCVLAKQLCICVQLRMSSRLLGVAGNFLLYTYFISRKPQPHLLRRIGECAVGISVMLSTYSVLIVAEDREAFLKLIPFGHVMLFVYGTLLGTVGLCYIPGLFVYDLTIALVVLLSASTVGVDMRMWYWTQRRGLHYWNQMRLIIDNLAIVAGALLYLTCTERELPPLPVEEETLQSEEGKAEESAEKKLN